MKRTVLKTGIRFSIVVGILLMGALSTAWSAEKEKTILVAPFQINSAEPLNFLKQGINRMIDTRLTEKGRSRVVFVPEAVDISGRDADYIIEGTILIFGDQVNTDARLIAAGSNAVEYRFSQTGSQKGDVIKHIDTFTENVRHRVLDESPVIATIPPPGVAEKDVAPIEAKPTPLIPTPAPVTEEIWRGPSMNKIVSSLQVVDIDNDGLTEMLILADNEIEIYRRRENRLVPVSETKIDEINIQCLFVDTIDLDRDGRPEVCVSAVNDEHTRATSLVYRVAEMQLIKLLGPVNYLFRVVDTADGPILLGQATRGDDSRILRSPVVKLGLAPGGQDLLVEDKIFPFADSVFGIAVGDFMHDGKQTIAVLDLNGHISLYSSMGKALYAGSDEYGGSTAYVGYKGMRYTRDDGYQLNRLFLQQRIFAADVGGDGKTGLIVVKNTDSTKKLLSNTRVYRKGQIDRLMWNELGFVVQEAGQSLPGYISDYCLGDTDSDGNREVVFCVVSSAKLLKKRRSQIYSKVIK